MNEPVHILIVEDDVLIRRIYHDVLESEGYRISQAGSGEEALAYLQLITPDLILLDLGLPGIDGYEVARRVKADTSKPFIPIIMVSAHAEIATSVAGLDAGADDFLVKPVEIDELLAHIRAMLRLQKAQRSLAREQRKTELLLHLTRDLGASIELDALLTRFLDHLADAVGAVRASIILTGFLEDEIICYSSSRKPPTTTLEDILRRGVAGWVMRHREPIVIGDTRQDERWFRDDTQDGVRSVASMPVIREGRVLGAITLVHHTPGYFSPDHVELLASVAAQSAVALESAQLFSVVQRQKALLERRAEELRRINEINAMLSELMSTDQLGLLLVHMVQTQFGYPLVSLLLKEGDSLALVAAAGENDPDPPIGLRIPADQGLSGWAIRTQQPARVDDTRADDRFVPVLPDDRSARSALVVPIVLRREVLGALEVRSSLPAAFGPNDEAILSAIVNQLGIALGNARLLELEQQRIQQLSQVNRLSVAITAQLDAPQNLQLAADAVALIFGAQQAGLILFDDDHEGHILVALHRPGMADDRLVSQILGEPATRRRLAELKAPSLMSDLPDHEHFAPIVRFLRGAGMENALIVPLVSGGRPAGLLTIDARGRTVEGFARADLELAVTVASLVVQVIENARLYRIVADERSTLNAVLAGAADPILLVGPESELLLANRAAEEQLRLNLPFDRGKPLDRLALTARNPFLDQLVPLLQNGHADEAVELDLPQEVSYSVSVAPVRSAEHQPLGRVAVLRDITAIKRLERQERERVRGVFRRYVSPVVAEELLSAGEGFGRPTEREVAVLFADMRGFTTLTERTDPHVLVERILRRYFTAMTEVLYDRAGTIDKFLGDGIIGVFGSPILHPDDPARAVATAVDMQRAFGRLRADWRAELGLDIGMGIGISYGPAVVGNIGSDQRQDYTLIGDVVNTASRLSGLAGPGQIVISYHLHDALPQGWDEYTLRPLGPVALKGKQQPHRVFEVHYSAE